MFLSPDLTDTQSHDVFQKFIDFYLNGKEGLSQQDAYQIIEVSNKKSWVEFILRPTVSRPVRLGIGPPFGAHDQIYLAFFFLTDNYFYSFSYGILSDEKKGL
jgi:hypothetical protein